MSDNPFLLTSDQHLHSWSAFSTTLATGVNSRLDIILNELVRADKVAKKAGADRHRLAGDLFHVRGNVKPSVLNPTVATFRDRMELCMDSIAGNHDLEGKDSSELGNAMQVLGTLPNFRPITDITVLDDVVMFPWFSDLNALRAAMKAHATDEKDAIIHAPINGVIKGIPDHGLEADELAEMGFRRVFGGHYHDHKVFCDGKVISIGATTHQTWSDPGTKAGFLLVFPDRIEHHESQAPKFLDVDDAFFLGLHAAGEDWSQHLAGNYVRVKLEDVTDAEIAHYRKEIEAAGAAGVSIIASKKRDTTRIAVSRVASGTLESTVSEFIKDHQKPSDIKAVQAAALDVLTEARSKG